MRPGSLVRRGAGKALVAFVIALGIFGLVPGGATGKPLYQTELAPPFAAWEVEVRVSPRVDPPDERILELSFNSALLGFRVHNTVLVPDAYAQRSGPAPVAYYLHGTRSSQQQQLVGEDAASVWRDVGLEDLGFGNPFDETVDGEDPDRWQKFLDRHQYLIVVPDTGDQAWCADCSWIDARDEGGLAAESHLVKELMPLVEAVFDVRTDRGGRALFGASMGANATAYLGFRHPDRFAFLGLLQGGFDKMSEPNATGSWLQKWRRHGYGDPRTDEIHWRNVSPMDLAPQMVGANVELMLMVGDGCLLFGPNPTQCSPSELGPALTETQSRFNQDKAVSRLAEMGVPFTYIQREGVHGDGRQETYRDFFLPRLNKLFSESVADPVRFTYKTVDTAFSIWGFDFSVDRGNNEFLNILGARRDARDLMLAGTGIVHVRTPPVFHPGRSYRVLVTPAGQPSQESVVVPVGEGRIELDVTLGPPRDVDERRELVENGQFPFPVTRIEVLDRARTALALDAPAAGQITDPVQVRATLTSHGVPLSGKPVSFELGSQHVAATTGSDGVAAATLVLTAPAGPTELSAAFSGDEAYDESRQVAAFEVTKETTLLTYEGEPRAKGETVHAAARLVEDDGPGLVGVPVTFEIKGSRTTVLTDGTGRATADLTVGDHGRSQVLTITYPGDASYSSAQQSVTVAWGKGLL